ncbi:MAG: hypothetical protein JWO04_3039 [Gammaproteobacteria bacterium]|nr:hypothetical protein [Gammaproteobacteria bacterium]
MNIKHPVLAAIACGAIKCATLTASAAEPTYNPDKLGSPQILRVENICQKVMGLSPNEPVYGGYWRGDDRLDFFTNMYRGCIVSLSDSLQTVRDDHLTQQADSGCRAKGYATGSPNLALCVVRSVNSKPNPPSARSAAPPVVTVSANRPAALPLASVSYKYASPHQDAVREERACAALGFEPSHGGFKTCVKALSDTLYDIDNPM